MYTFRSIFRESIGVLIVAALLGTIGGIALQSIQQKFIMILPLVILLPALSDMVGDFGIIVVSRFTTALYLGKITKPWYKSHFIEHLLREVIPIALIAAVYSTILAISIAALKGYAFSISLSLRVLTIALLTTILLLFVILTIAILGGLYIFHKQKDPDDVLIPITTSIADLASLLLLTLLVIAFF